MIVFPNAKINIGLDVLNRRSDGYHDISTVMMPIPWCDVLEIVISDGDRDHLSISGRSIDCPPDKNLVMKAVALMRNYAGFPSVNIFLHKVIPDGAGLGGGSADAAFALKTIKEMFLLGFSDELLAGMASSLGADCPFFIYNRPMLCEGTGTTLSPINLVLPENLWVIVVKPPVAVSTKDAYAGVAPCVPALKLPELLTTHTVDQWQGKVKNDFEKSVFIKYPEIKSVKDNLIDMGAVYSAMSGSGSSVFGLFYGDILTDSLSAKFTGCDIFVKKLFS